MSDAPAPVTDLRDLRARAEALLPDLAALRHDLHRIPEIGLDLPLTQGRVLAALDELRAATGATLEVTTGTGLSSVVA